MSAFGADGTSVSTAYMNFDLVSAPDSDAPEWTQSSQSEFSDPTSIEDRRSYALGTIFIH